MYFRTWQNGTKLHGEMGRLGIRKRFFTESMVRHWKWCLEMGARGLQGRFLLPTARAHSSHTCSKCCKCFWIWTTNCARQRFMEQEWWQQRSRTYCALGCLQRQQGNLPQRNKTWQNVFRSYIHYKAVNIYACCVLSGGQAAWLGTGREITQ